MTLKDKLESVVADAVSQALDKAYEAGWREGRESLKPRAWRPRPTTHGLLSQVAAIHAANPGKGEATKAVQREMATTPRNAGRLVEKARHRGFISKSN
jgi:hypothetical protein